MNKKLWIAGGLVVVAVSAATFIFLKKRKQTTTEDVTEEPTPETTDEIDSESDYDISVIKERLAKEAIEKPEFQDYINDVINKNIHLFKPPYYISEDEIVNPEEEYEDYDVVTLTYYKDGVLADGDDILEPEDCVPTDFADKFNDGEDVVYVRNEKLETVFEILNQPYDAFHDVYKYVDDGGFDDV